MDLRAAGILCFCLLCLAIFQGAVSAATQGEFTPKRSVIVVLPKDWDDSLEEWARYRETEYQILRVQSVDSPYELRQTIIRVAENAKLPVTAVLLCGDAFGPIDPANPSVRPKTITPTFELPTTVKLGPYTTPTLATDVLFGDLDNDECPDIAVGRLPAKNKTDLRRMLHRSLQYEQSQTIGPWRDRIHAVAGVGGFGMIADGAIESVTRRLLSEGIPDRFQLQMTYASLTSPYCPDPQKLTSSFISRINSGGLFWVYIGHGNVNRLDDFQVGDELVPICTQDHVPQFQIQDGAPIAVILACFTGAFDARVDCFAEQLLSKDDGPIAVIAGSRVTMPYGMSQFSTELIEGCFQDRLETLGEMVLQSKRRIWQTNQSMPSEPEANTQSLAPDADNPSVRFSQFRQKLQKLIGQMAAALSPEGHDLTNERREHVRLMNLLGDPLLRIRQPKELPMQCDATADAGESIEVTCEVPFPCRLKMELALSRDRLPAGIEAVRDFDGSDTQRDAMQRNYTKASDLTLVSSEQEVTPGTFRHQLLVPADSRGRYVVRVYAYGENEWATGSKRITVQRIKK